MKNPELTSECVKKLQEHLQESYELAAEDSCKMSEKNKPRFYLKVRAAELIKLSVRGKYKLANRWKKMVHTAVKRILDGPVYVVKLEMSNTISYCPVGSCLRAQKNICLEQI
ncbi:hypothetical protein M9458_053509 [Cirrhinus mrigala]|uniref:Uncharacterized protein n=1 Tax=Cirrhinus mrigala TaxID=683832 RepID=A0ABD0MQ98_CIRMR